MARYKAIIEYDGTNYGGFQIQNNALTIQAVLEKSLSELYRREIKVVGSGRTDAGVHALGQVIHFDAEENIPANQIPLALAQYLPKDIAMRSCEQVNETFHARFSAVSKTYVYSVILSKVNRPLSYNHYLYPYTLDFELIEAAIKRILGEHDFKGFMASGSDVKNTVRRVTDLELIRNDDELIFSVSANGFLYNMVRNIVGMLLDIGRGFKSLEDLDMLITSGDRKYAGHTAPSVGLCLKQVIY